MGPVTLPVAGTVYVNTPIVIYTVEGVSTYKPLLRPFWEAARSGAVSPVSSSLTLMETLVVPMRTGNDDLARAYEEFLLRADIRLLPIGTEVLREAARLRATTSLRTPDAIHVASAALATCRTFLTNDSRLRSVPGLSVVVLGDLE